MVSLSLALRESMRTRSLIQIGLLMAAMSATACTSVGTSDGSSALQAFNGAPRPAEQPTAVASAIMEAMAGGLVGGTLGTRLDARERRHALESEYRALEYTPPGENVTWGQEGGKRYGQVVAGAPYRVGSQDCRQYRHTVYINGQPQAARGAACRNADGSWSPLA